MACRQRTDSDNMDVVLDSLPRRFSRRTEQGANIDIEPQVGERAGNHLLAPVVTILSHFGDQDPRSPTFDLLKPFGQSSHVPSDCLVFDRRRIDAADRMHGRLESAERLFQSATDFAHGRFGSRGVDRKFQQVAVLAARRFGQRVQRGIHVRLIARRAQPPKAGNLRLADGRVINSQDTDRLLVLRPILVHADHRLLSGIDSGLGASRRLFDPHFGNAGLNRLRHSTQLLHFANVAPGALRQIVRQPLDKITAAPRIDDTARIGFLLQEQLRVARDSRRKVRGQGERFVQCIGVQRLRVSVGGRHCLQTSSNHIVVHILRRQAPAARLTVGSQRQALGVLRIERLDQLRPDHARRPQLGYFHEVVHADCPEERQTRAEGVDGQPGSAPRPHILQAIGQRIGQLQIGRRSRLLHVISADADAVVTRHPPARVFENVGDDPNARLGRVDVRVANHELLEDIVLNRARQLLRLHALFFGRDNIEGHDRQHGPVHGHRNAHPIQRDTLEQRTHVVDAVDGHARHANVARHSLVIRVVAAMRGQIKGNAQALLPRRKIAAVESVGVLGRGEAGVLPHRPRSLDIHGCVGSPQERRESGHRVQVIKALEVGRRVEWADRNLLGSLPDFTARQTGQRFFAVHAGRALRVLVGLSSLPIGLERHVGKVGYHGREVSFRHRIRLPRAATRAV